MRNLINILLEAPIDAGTVQKMIDSGNRVSIYYQGDDDNKKGWKKVEPIRIEGEGADAVVVAYEIESISKKPEIKRFLQSKITNWNTLGTIKATFSTKEKGKEKEKEKKKPGAKTPVVKKPSLDKEENTICDAIINKRFVKFYYKGDKENAPGWRTDIQPVAFGKGHTGSPKSSDLEYIRAWQGSGKTTTEVPGWKFFRVDRIKNWSVDSTKTFKSPPDPRFNPAGDGTMIKVICITDFKSNSTDSKINEASILPAIKDAINIF